MSRKWYVPISWRYTAFEFITIMVYAACLQLAGVTDFWWQGLFMVFVLSICHNALSWVDKGKAEIEKQRQEEDGREQEEMN